MMAGEEGLYVVVYQEGIEPHSVVGVGRSWADALVIVAAEHAAYGNDPKDWDPWPEQEPEGGFARIDSEHEAFMTISRVRPCHA